MQERKFISESLSKISYLRAKSLINENDYYLLRSLLDGGEYGEFERTIKAIFKDHNIDPNIASNFIDSIKNPNLQTNSIYENSYKESEEYDSISHIINTKKSNNQSEKAKEVLKLRSEISYYRNAFKEEQGKLKKLDKTLSSTDEELVKLKIEHEKLKSQLQQSRIEDKIPDYVSDVSDKLSSDDQLFMDKSKRWSRTGITFASIAVGIALYSFKTGFDSINANNNLNITSILYIFFRGIIAIGILTWISHTCFQMSSSYIHESILRKDRQHALSFGRLFLQIYGDMATKAEAIEVFKDWNRTGNSAFSKKISSPPNIKELINSIKNMKESKEKNDTID
ncbi:hypothetical protein [Brenneria corticis]|nr:hypothetical protein [Brenneria sp. CFCC 11842]